MCHKFSFFLTKAKSLIIKFYAEINASILIPCALLLRTTPLVISFTHFVARWICLPPVKVIALISPVSEDGPTESQILAYSERCEP